MFTEAIYKLKFKNTDDYFTRMLILEFILRYNNYHKNDGAISVFHLAANPRVEFSVKNPAISTEANLMKTIELLSAYRKTNIDKFVSREIVKQISATSIC